MPASSHKPGTGQSRDPTEWNGHHSPGKDEVFPVAGNSRTGAARRPVIALVAPRLEILGGQGVQAMSLAQELRREGHEIRFIPITPVFPRGWAWVRRVPVLRTLLNEALYLPSLSAVLEADVVHVFSASYWSFLLAPVPAMAAAALAGRPVVLHYHSGEAEDHLANWGRLVHPWLRLATRIVVPSEYLKRVFGRHGYETRVIRNVVDTGCFRFRERQPLQPRLLSVRNFETHYRVDNTLRAFALVKARCPGAVLTLAGYGSGEARLRRLAAELGCGGISFAGRVEPEDMPALFDRADIFLNSSEVDNQPVSILEAFAAGLCVVSTPTGDIPAMLDYGNAGKLVPAGDPEAMAAAVMELLESPRAAEQMAHNGRSAAAHYDWSEIRDQWSAVYLALAA